MPHSKRTTAGVLGGLVGLVGLSMVAGVLVAATVTPAVAVTSAAATSAIDMFNNLPSVLTIDKLILPSTIYAKDAQGKQTVMATYYDQNRKPVAWNQVNPVMYDAILSSEDPRYYEHGGIDPIGTARAFLSNLKGGATQGGSSISQQYVKNVLVQQCYWNAKSDKQLDKCYAEATDSDTSDGTGYQRKLQEMRYSIALEQRYSKNEILLGYLNIANFGGTTYGIEAAAERYFGVPASKLDLSQAATLAGMVNSPNILRIDQPTTGTTVNAKKQPVNTAKDGYALTKKRQEYVLGRMLTNGKITQAQHDAAVKAPITPHLTQPGTGCVNSEAPYFCAYVTSVVLNDPAFGKTDADRQQLLHRGGLNIYTTLDPKLQQAAQTAVSKYVPAEYPGMDLGGVSVSVEASTGRVLSMAQNTTYTAGGGKSRPGQSALVYAGDNRLNHSGGFEAGSTFKLFTLLEWLQQGKSLYERVDGTEHSRTNWTSHCVPGGIVKNPYNVDNFGTERGHYGTPMQFTAASLNSGFTGMAHELDLCNIGQMAANLGVDDARTGQPVALTSKNPLPSEIIGQDQVSPLAMAGAYAAVANKGVFCQPRVIDKVTGSDGQPLPLPERTCKRVFSEKVAAGAAYALHGVMTGGTGTGGNPFDGTPLFGKTGTFQEWQTWLIVANSKVATANWVGNASGHQVDLSHHSTNGNLLWNLRYPLAKSVQTTVDKLYPGAALPKPDNTLVYGKQAGLPNVVGMSQSAAEQTLKAAGFDVQVGAPVNSSQAAGVIAQQSPGAGQAALGSTVTISPSNGKPGADLPDVTGQQPDAAVAALKAAGFGNVSVQCDKSPDGNGQVAGMSPSAGTAAAPGTKVTLTYQAPSCKPGGKDDHH